MTISENISLNPYNTFGIDVEAKLFVEINSEEILQEIIADKNFSTEEIEIHRKKI